MNSRSCSHLTAMAFLVLLVAIFSTVSTVASASTLRSRKLRPTPKAAPGLSSSAKDDKCLDNPDWLFKDDPLKDCDWIGAKDKRKTKKCKKKDVRQNCKQTCGKCGKKKCPNKVDSKKFGDSCQEYKDGLECRYDYTVIGCGPSTFQCVAGSSWTCGDDYGWTKESLPKNECFSLHQDWGTVCDPDEYTPPEDGNGLAPLEQCPETIESPEFGQSCEFYKDGLECLYGYSVRGCLPGDFFCSPGVAWTCSDHIWTKEFLNQLLCFSEHPDFATACDPEDYEPPTLLDTCPETIDSPEFKESCVVYEDGLECMYDYTVIGCEPSSFSCSPGTSWTCSANTWTQDSIPQIKCISEDPEWGTTCDPDTYKPPVGGETPVECPDNEPIQGDDCERTGLTPNGCPYRYSVDGCTADTLNCRPVTTFSCKEAEGGGLVWEQEIFGSEFCADAPPNWPSGDCDPDDFDPGALFPDDGTGTYCPPIPPQMGSPCTRLGPEAANTNGCSYNHMVIGCNFDDLACAGIATAFCEGPDPTEVCKGDSCEIVEHTLWEVAMMSVEFCDSPPNGSPWGTDCNPDTFDKEDFAEIYTTPTTPIEKPFDCPEEEPESNTHCSTDGITPPGGCPYNYIVSGCTQDTLSCGPVVTATCEGTEANLDGVWWIESHAAQSCGDGMPKGWPAGLACDPSEFDAGNYRL